jgi:hypothetical protein
LACHKASGQDVDTLKEPDRSEKHEQGTNDNERNTHGYDLGCIRSVRAYVDRIKRFIGFDGKRCSAER